MEEHYEMVYILGNNISWMLRKEWIKGVIGKMQGGRTRWLMPVIPATQEAEAGELLEPGSTQMLQ